MSSIFNGLFGGSNQQSTNESGSYNQAYPYLQGQLGGNIGNVGAAGSQIANMLGLNGGSAQNQGFNNWRNSTGYQFGLNQGMDSINGNAATQGLLNSGGTAKALDTYGQNYANTQYGNYMGQLQNLLNSGNTSAGILGSTGGVSQSSGQSTGSYSSGGLGAALGQGANGLGQLLPKVFAGI